MAGVRFTIQADPSQLTAGLDAASAQVESWAGTTGATIASSMGGLQQSVRNAFAEVAAARAQLAGLGDDTVRAGESMSDYMTRMEALGQATARMQAAQGNLSTSTAQLVEAQKLAKLTGDQLADSNDRQSSSGINVTNMIDRMVLRMAVMYAVIRPVLDIIKEAVAEHEAWAAASQRMDYELAANGDAVLATSGKMETFAETMARVGKFNADQVLTSFDDIYLRARDASTSMQLVQDAENLAAASGIKLSDATKAVDSAIQGSFGALERQGVYLDADQKATLKAETEQERAVTIHDILFSKFAGAMDQGQPELTFWQKVVGGVDQYIASLTSAANKRQGLSGSLGFLQAPLAALGLASPIAVDYSALLGNTGGANATGKTATEDPGTARLNMQAEADIAVKDAEAYLKLVESKQALVKINQSVETTEDQISKTFDVAPMDKYDSALQKVSDDLARDQQALLDKASADNMAAQVGDAQVRVLLAQAAAIETKSQVAQQEETATKQQIALWADEAANLRAAAAETASKASADRAAAQELTSFAETTLVAEAANKMLSVAESEAAKEAQQLANMVSTAQRQLDLFGQKTKDSLAGIFSGPQLDQAKAQVDSIMADYDAAIAAAAAVGGFLGMSPDDLKTWIDEIKQAGIDSGNQFKTSLIDAAKAYGEELKKQNDQTFQDLSSDFQNLFDAGVSGNIKGALESIFKQTSKDFGKDLAIAIGGGPPPNPANYPGGAASDQYKADAAAYQAGPAGTLDTIMKGVGAAYGAYQAFQTIGQPGTSIGAGALTGLSAGASIGGLVGTIVPVIGNAVGAVVGAIVGAIAGAVAAASGQSKGSTFQYLVPEYGAGDSRGWFAETSQNLNQAAVQQFLDQLQATMDSLNDGFVNIIAKFPGNLLAAGLGVLQSERFTGGESAIGGDQWGTIGSAPSEHSMQQLQTYISSGLPQEIFGDFRNLLVQGFQNMGFSSGGANALIDQAQKMDPTAAIKFLSTIQDAITEFNKVVPELSQSFMPSGANGLFSSGGGSAGSIWQDAWNQTNQTFAASLADSQQQMLQLAATIPLLSGQDQADAIKQLADLNVQRYQAEIQFAQQLQAAVLNMNRSFDADIRSKQIAGMVDASGKPDYARQESFLQSYLSKLEGQASAATTPDQLNYLQAQIQQTIDQMVSIADNSGNPAMKSQYDQWGISALQTAESFLDDQYKRLGAGIDDLNKQLTDAESGFITALQNGTLALNDFSGAGSSGGGGGGGGGGASGGGKSSGGDFGANDPTTIQAYGVAISTPILSGLQPSTTLSAAQLGEMVAQAKLTNQILTSILGAAGSGTSSGSGGFTIHLNVTSPPPGSSFLADVGVSRQ